MWWMKKTWLQANLPACLRPPVPVTTAIHAAAILRDFSPSGSVLGAGGPAAGRQTWPEPLGASESAKDDDMGRGARLTTDSEGQAEAPRQGETHRQRSRHTPGPQGQREPKANDGGRRVKGWVEAGPQDHPVL